MSVIREITIRCDECGVKRPKSDILTVTQMRSTCKMLGWGHQISRDFCPSCEEKIEKQKQESTQ